MSCVLCIRCCLCLCVVHSWLSFLFTLVFILSCVLCIGCCQCLCVVHSWLPLRFSLVFIRPFVLCGQCCQCLYIVHSWLPLRFSLVFIRPFVLCDQCCECLYIVHSWLPLRFSLVFIRPLGLPSRNHVRMLKIIVHELVTESFTNQKTRLTIVHERLFSINRLVPLNKQKPEVAIKNGQCKNTDNFDHTRQKGE
jgi:hypothetical protein